MGRKIWAWKSNKGGPTLKTTVCRVFSSWGCPLWTSGTLLVAFPGSGPALVQGLPWFRAFPGPGHFPGTAVSGCTTVLVVDCCARTRVCGSSDILEPGSGHLEDVFQPRISVPVPVPVPVPPLSSLVFLVVLPHALEIIPWGWGAGFTLVIKAVGKLWCSSPWFPRFSWRGSASPPARASVPWRSDVTPAIAWGKSAVTLRLPRQPSRVYICFMVDYSHRQ